MARKTSKRQVSFDSLLEPDVPLDPRVVLITDPRWAAALVEMSTTLTQASTARALTIQPQRGADHRMSHNAATSTRSRQRFGSFR